MKTHWDETPGLLVSIIIPCYNAERFIGRAIQSALNQTYPHCEIIVIDDGSTDGSLRAITAFGHGVRWETGPNQGGCAARNRGIAIARGIFYQFLDADDLIHPDKISIQLRQIAGNDRALANCTMKRFSSDAPPWNILDGSPPSITLNGLDFVIKKRLDELSADLDDGGTAPPPHSFTSCWLVPKTLAEPWDTRLSIAQDTEYFERISLRADKVVTTAAPLVHYRDSLGSVSKGMSRRHAESLFHYCQTTERTLEIEDSERVRRGIAKQYFATALRLYPDYPDLVDASITRIRHLGNAPGSEAPNAKIGFAIREIGIKNSIRLIKSKQFLRKLVQDLTV